MLRFEDEREGTAWRRTDGVSIGALAGRVRRASSINLSPERQRRTDRNQPEKVTSHAYDAYLRKLDTCVPANCTAVKDLRDHPGALRHLRTVLKAHTGRV